MKYLALVSLLLVACGDDTSFVFFDGGQDAGDDAMDAGDDAMDAGDDAGVLESSDIFRPCVADSQCPGPDAFCRQPVDGYNDGQCTRSCVNVTPCDDGRVIGWCLDDPDRAGMSCWPRCRNSVDCSRDNYICIEIDELGTNPGGRCVGFCKSDDQCDRGSECNEQAGSCVPAGTTPAAGAVTGEACAADGDCISGDCTTAAQGQPGGSCETLCAVGPGFQNSNFYLGDTLPTNNCPNEGDICLPIGNVVVAGSEGRCYSPCTMDTDCRAGRTCLRAIAGHRFTNGVCLPER